MNKAYDRIEWEFMLETLNTISFDTRWISWTKECVTKMQYIVVVNEKKTRRFRPTRGIWQGDPLFPYLFILVAYVLSWNITSAVERNDLKGI